MIFGVLYVPVLCENLMSVSRMAKHRMSVLFEDKKVVVRSKDMGNLVAQGTKKQGLYRLSVLLVWEDLNCSKLWHDRFGHINYSTLFEMART